ncbi:MAG TPA: TlpA disulfide reductase family protein [Puia sp.]|nr:TlpA disulfide reductase family protein [Puia sp.]
MSAKIFLCSLFCLTFIFTAASQPKESPVYPLKVGDYVPEDFSLGKVLNFYKEYPTFSDFRGKLLILDFWASWCVPCIKGFETTDSLQNEFNGKLQVLGVSEHNTDKPASIPAFFAKHGIKISTVVDDSLISRMFPHRLIPHYVWILPSGKVVAITGGDAVTRANVWQALETQALSVKIKQDREFSHSKPLFFEGNGGAPDHVLYQSILTDSVDGLPGFSRTFGDTLGNVTAYSAQTSDIGLINEIFTLGRLPVQPNPRTFFIRRGDTLLPIPSELKDGDWMVWDSLAINKVYAYSMWLPPGIKVKDTVFFRQYVLDDLNRALPFRAVIEKKTMPCFVIRRKKDFDEAKIKTSNKFPQFYYSSLHQAGTHDGYDMLDHIENMKFSSVVTFLRDYPFTDPIIDESGISDKRLDMDFHLKFQIDQAWNKPLDVPAARAALGKIGLEMVTEMREHDVIVLDKK